MQHFLSHHKCPKSYVFICIFFLNVLQTIAQAPVITSFSPQSGPVGTTVTISGTGFNIISGNNIVYFGAVKAAVSASTGSSLTVNVPAGATYQPITVTNNGLTAYSAKPFIVTFAGGGAILQSSFAYKIDSTTGLYPFGIIAVDLDGNGKADLATANNANSPSSTVSVLRNTGSSGAISFSGKTDYAAPPGSTPYSIATGDIDGDGRPDLVVPNGNNTVSVFRNTSAPGAISLAARVDFTTGTNPYHVAIGDLDGDGKPDLVVANYLSNSVSVFRNTSTTGIISFAARVDITTALAPHSVSIGDIDGDGKPDLAVANSLSKSISIFRNLSSAGAMSFAAKADFSIGASEPFDIATSDLDGDGKPDLVISYANINTVYDAIVSFSVLRNTSSPGSFSLAPKADYARGDSYHISIGDLNGDGKPDLVVPNSYNGLAVFQNTSTVGSISLATEVDFYTGSSYNTAIGDFDGDNKPDLAVANSISNTVSLLRNKVNEPFIISFSPAAAGTGATVTITGANFIGATAVSFGGVPATSFTVVNATTINAVVGASVSGDISVTTPYGTASISGFIFAGPPVITSFTPIVGARGDSITVTGNNFTGATAVNFGGIPSASFVVVSPTKIVAVIATGATGDIAITNPYGTVTRAGFSFIPPPVITSFTPAFGGAGTAVTITGNNFTGATAVSFGGIPAASFSIISSSSIVAILGSGGTGDVTVQTPGGIARLSGFTAAPLILSISPDTAIENTTINIRGGYFTGTTAVSFGGIPVRFTVNTDTSITAVVGISATGNVVVTTPAGTASMPGFVFIPKPVITSYTPATGGTGTVVTITGSNFTGTTTVSFGNVPAASFTVLSPTTITAVAGEGNEPAGYISVTTRGGTATVPGFRFKTVPVISSFYPVSGPAGTTVTVIGANFSPLPADNFVYFGAVRAPVIGATATSLTVKVPIGVTYQPITVTTHNLTAYATRAFLVTFSAATDFIGSRIDFVTGKAPESVAAGDMNGDGLPDLVVANYGSRTISVYKNTSRTGNPSFTAKMDFDAGPNPNNITIADIDGDGKPDIICLNRDSVGLAIGNTVSILKNTTASGGISFASRVTFPTALNAASIAVGDMDGDGRPDLAIANEGQLSFSTLRNIGQNGIISFEQKLDREVPFSSITSLSMADINGDGVLDLVVNNMGDNTFSTYINASYKGYITFANKVDKYYPGGIRVFLNDLDGDGKPDLAVTQTSGINVFRNVTGESANGLSFPIIYQGGVGYTIIQAGSYSSVIAVNDVDGDGRPDMVVPNKDSNMVAVLKNTGFPGTISFAGKLDYRTGNAPSGVAVCDIDGDARPDIIVTNKADNTLSILRNTANTTSLPSINAVTPSSGPNGTMVTITGANLAGATVVSFGGINAESFTVISPTEITAIVGSDASGLVSVITPYGVASIGGFVNTSPPLITGFTPHLAGTGMSVTIEGRNFTGATSVSFGGTPAQAFTVASPARITAIVGTGTNGSISVTTPYGTAILAGFTYIVTPSITPGSATTFCQGGHLILTSSASSNNQWYKDSIAISGATGDTLSVTASGTYTVAAAVNGVISSRSAGVIVTVNPIPAKPVITLNASNVLVSSSISGNQWYIDTVSVITSATSQTYKPVSPGEYAVRVTQNGCVSSFSDRYHYLPTAVINIGGVDHVIHLTPNPGTNFIRINFNLPGIRTLIAELSDINGARIMTNTNIHDGDMIDISGLVQGIYFVRVHSPTHRVQTVLRFIKLKS